MPSQIASDILILGSGAAGLSAALHLAPWFSVSILSKGTLREGNTSHAQGGISAVLSADDSVESHVADTVAAGGGLCSPPVVEFVAGQGAECVNWLIENGVRFTRDSAPTSDSGYHLTREGGHSHRRVIHAADATGVAIVRALTRRARGHPGITVYESHIAVDLITVPWTHGRRRCIGAYVLNRRTGRIRVFRARAVILATGGAGKVYLYTSNPDVATGDGIAMAWRAGCRVANMEFVQFHPTCLYHPDAKSLLITEAVRGEGGRLRLSDGECFMGRFDPRAELAPRDIVARAIDHEMKRLGDDCVYLDISHRDAEFVRSHFPNVHARCLSFGIDMTREPVPVVPAAHYTCGGVVSDLRGRADIPGLYAIGEVAFTGLHGANRMASNSLLECLVFARAAARDIRERIAELPPPPSPDDWDESQVTDSDEEVVVAHNWDELRRFMWDYVGIVRTDKRLQRARRRVELLLSEIDDYYGNFRIDNDLIELRNVALCADLIIRCALHRKESRGLHFTLDYPEARPGSEARNTILEPQGYRVG